ncbi:family 43 glycosylhydrolase [Hymenobacter sp. HD11105]|jgi:arabinan endo-1,5-alpha-L-arabinosidase
MKKLLYLCLLLATAPWAQAQTQANKELVPAHDPVMIQQGDTYYMFCTGPGIAVWSSKNRQQWKPEKPVFDKAPEWAVKAVPGFKNNHIWAPDISFQNGQYYLYYSISAFGKNTSCIGVATNKTLNPASPDYKWVDKGKVVQSVPGRDMWNAIDPNLARDTAGKPWLSFGSFWNGIKLVKLRDDLTGVAEPEQWRTIASRPRSAELTDSMPGDAAIEAPFIFKKGDYYYLFTSFDYCCRGPQSTYKMVVGRAKELIGPYVDKAGVGLEQGGGTLVMEGNKDWFGVGHNSVYTFDKQDFLVFHGYDAADKGRSKLRMEKLAWDKDGWPTPEKK